MRRDLRRWAVTGLSLLGMGCASSREARYVYQDGDAGVIAIEQNTPKQMDQAVRLMEKHFPGKNYEVVRTVEVDEGKRTLFESDKRSADLEPRLENTLFKTGKWHRDRDSTHSDQLTIRECRIIYRKKNALIPPSLAFATSPKYSPELYPDPIAREMAEEKLALAKKDAVKDGEVKPASLEAPSSPNPPLPPR